MRKVIKRPDGTEEIVEGTADEIAEYERRLKEGGKLPSTSKRKPVLHGASVDGKPLTDEEISLIRLHRLGALPREKEREVIREPIYIPQWISAPYTLKGDKPPCKFCGQLDCHQLHIWCGTTPSDKITINSDITVPNAYLFYDGNAEVPVSWKKATSS